MSKPLESPAFVQYHLRNLTDLGFALRDVDAERLQAIYLKLGPEYDYRLFIGLPRHQARLSVEIYRYYKSYSDATMTRRLVFEGYLELTAADVLLGILHAVLNHP